MEEGKKKKFRTVLVINESFFYKVSSFLIKIEAECSVHIHIYIISLHFFFNLFYRRVFSSTLFS